MAPLALRVLGLLLVMTLPAAAHAERGGLFATVRQDVAGGFHVGLDIVQAPFRADGEEWLQAGGIAAGMLATTLLDRTVRSNIPDWHDGWTATVDDAGFVWSRSRVLFGTAGGLYAAGLIAGDDDVRRTGLEIVEAFALAHAGTQTIKHLVGRHRPYLEDGPYTFEGPTRHNRFLSFPSGDATNAFALSTVLASEIRRPAATVILYSFAGATLFQRLHQDKHWFSDVVTGAVWSTIAARTVVLYNRKLTAVDGGAWSIAPAPAGLRLTVRL